eukprot:2490923-Ditylum_brightwellii.AAC.1
MDIKRAYLIKATLPKTHVCFTDTTKINNHPVQHSSNDNNGNVDINENNSTDNKKDNKEAFNLTTPSLCAFQSDIFSYHPFNENDYFIDTSEKN